MSWQNVDKAVSLLFLLWAIMLLWCPLIMGIMRGKRGAIRGFWASGLPFLAAALFLACSVRHEQISKAARERWYDAQRITPDSPDWYRGKQPFTPCPLPECR